MFLLDGIYHKMRVLVYVHGACIHEPGFSDSWWQLLKPYTNVYGQGVLGQDRYEVCWSDLITHGLVHHGPWAYCFADFFQYLNDLDKRLEILERFTSVVQPLVDQDNQVDIISHSEGTIIAYEGLREMIPRYTGYIGNLFTLGSALGFQYGLLPGDNVRNRLMPANQDGRKPYNVAYWWNLVATGDPVGTVLAPAYEVTEDFVNLEAVGCDNCDLLCAHGSYFDPSNIAVQRDIIADKINMFK